MVKIRKGFRNKIEPEKHMNEKEHVYLVTRPNVTESVTVVGW